MSIADQYAGMASDMARAREREADQRAANAVLRRAEHSHGRTMALLVAALEELRRAAPDSLVLVDQVQEKIRAKGGGTIDRSRSFQPVWELAFDLPSILIQCQNEHEEAKAAVVKKLEAAESESKRFFWRPWKKYGRVAGLKFATVEEAEAARLQALRLARGAQLGGELDISRLLRTERERE